MDFLKRMLISDIEPTQAERDRVAEVKSELDQTRSEYRQTILRIEASMRLMKEWESANRMVKE